MFKHCCLYGRKLTINDKKVLKYYHNSIGEAGTDEAGRGCLAGPVCAAAVMLSNDFHHPILNDSKILSEKKRQLLKPFIKAHAVSYAVSFVDQNQIDEINILNASLLAMHQAIDSLDKTPSFIIVDGNRFKKYKNIPHECIIKGDSIYQSIAAASILAKTHRDEYMERIHEEYPVYNWKRNKGYPTKEHREAILKHGITKYHRLSFRLLPEQLQLDL